MSTGASGGRLGGVRENVYTPTRKAKSIGDNRVGNGRRHPTPVAVAGRAIESGKEKPERRLARAGDRRAGGRLAALRAAFLSRPGGAGTPRRNARPNRVPSGAPARGPNPCKARRRPKS